MLVGWVLRVLDFLGDLDLFGPGRFFTLFFELQLVLCFLGHALEGGQVFPGIFSCVFRYRLCFHGLVVG